MQQPPQSTVTLQLSVSRLASRVLSILVLGLLFAVYLQQSEITEGAMGKAAYLAAESSRYDKFLAQPRLGTPIGGFILVGIFLIGYELLALALDKAIVNPIANSLRAGVQSRLSNIRGKSRAIWVLPDRYPGIAATR